MSKKIRSWWGSVLALVSSAALAQEFGRGFVAEADAVYRSFPVTPRHRAFLPESADLSSRFPAPGSQGRQGSCTAWATTYALRSYYEGQRQHWDGFESKDQVFSPAWTYNRLTGYSGNCDQGTAISEALRLLQEEGVPPFSAFPYQAARCDQVPDDQIRSVAGRFRIRSWRSIDPSRLDDVKGQLASGNPVVFGLNLSPSFDRLKAGEIYDDVDAPRDGGHAMVIVGYDEKRQAFKLFNSWGTHWGDQGFGWASYRVVRAHSQRYFVMEVDGANPEPAPQPGPPKPPEPAPQPESPKPPVPAPKPPEPPKPPVPAPKPPEPPKPPVPAPKPPEPPLPVPNPPEPPKPPVPAPKPPEPPKPPVPAPHPPKPVVTPPAPLPTLAELRRQIQARAAQVPCARLDARLGEDRVAHLQGFLGAATDLDKLQADLKALPGVKGLTSDVAVHAWPRCEVMLSFAEPLATPRGLKVRLSGASGADGAFREGDNMVIEITTPDYPSYVYISYLQVNGETVHLSWPNLRMHVLRPLPPNTRLVFGDGSKGEKFLVSPPYGDEVVVAVASASPLFYDDLAPKATDRDYLTLFRAAFLTRPKSGEGSRNVSATMAPISTRGK